MKKGFLFPLLASLAVLVMVSQAAANFLAGEEAYLQEDYETALQEWRPLAERGNAEAQNMLGYMYRYGQGVPQDFSQAYQWYRRAADKGHARAQNNLGAMYRQGLGVTQDYSEAIRWFRRSAEQGNGGAQNHLGLMYYQGEGVPKDKVQAYMWAYIAAQQGLDPAIQAINILDQELTPAEIAEAKRKAQAWTPKGEEVTL